jgi:cyclophilin family peptidyl-prolyl cis-trans isomerase
VSPEIPDPDGSSPQTQQFDGPPPMIIDPAKRYTAEVVTSKGTLVIALDAASAPATVNNFVFLARWHYYDDVVFHRIIPGFMLQGGDPTGTGRGGPGYRFADELPAPGRYEIGSVAMANAGPDTNGSQFFIVSGRDGVGLPPQYSLFGKVVGGAEVVTAIEATGSRSGAPSERVVIEAVTVTVTEAD